MKCEERKTDEEEGGTILWIWLRKVGGKKREKRERGKEGRAEGGKGICCAK